VATSADVARKILSKSKAIAHAVAHAPTGVTPGYHPALGATVGEDGRLSRVAGVGEQFYPALAHAEDVTTCVEDAVTRVGFTTLDYDPHGQLSFDDLQGTNWQYSTIRPGDTPPLALVQIGARVLMDTPAFGEHYDVGDNLGLWLYHYDEDTATATQVALLDYVLITVDMSGFGYTVPLQGTAVVPMVQAGEQYYYIGLANDSRFDRTITGGAGAPWKAAFWAIPVVTP
jgi:hypothetical protein